MFNFAHSSTCLSFIDTDSLQVQVNVSSEVIRVDRMAQAMLALNKSTELQDIPQSAYNI